MTWINPLNCQSNTSWDLKETRASSAYSLSMAGGRYAKQFRRFGKGGLPEFRRRAVQQCIIQNRNCLFPPLRQNFSLCNHIWLLASNALFTRFSPTRLGRLKLRSTIFGFLWPRLTSNEDRTSLRPLRETTDTSHLSGCFSRASGVILYIWDEIWLDINYSSNMKSNIFF